jgi:hypothetical protein
MDYNTQREHLFYNEYGRNIQFMVKNLLNEPNREKRQKQAEAIVEAMSVLNSTMKGVEDYKQKFWDHLFAITNYELDIDSPYGIPEREVKESRPEPVAYPGKKVKWSHLGRNVGELFQKAMNEQDPEKKMGYAQALGNYMKVLYKNYHDETVTDEAVKEEISQMSNGTLVYEANEFRKYVDSTLQETSTVINIRNHKANKNYFEQSKGMQHRGKGFRKFGNNKNFKKR